jgi:hypothetical protein
MRSDPKFGVKSIPGKKVPERRSGLCPSEKELSKRRSGAFRHKIPLEGYTIFAVKVIITHFRLVPAFRKQFLLYKKTHADYTVRTVYSYHLAD